MAPVHSRNALRIAVAVAALGLAQTCGGHSPTAAPPPSTAPTTTTLPPAPATLADLSGAVTSPETDASITCTQDVHARVSLTNRAASSVVVTGVVDNSGVIAGNCDSLPPFTFTTLTRVVPANSTTVVLDRGLYDGGSGCCQGRCEGGSCQILESFEVVTTLGNVPAGSFKYKIFFTNCEACSTAARAAGATCPRGLRASAR